MACATLKRSLEFDPVHSPNSRSPKRRRCIPMTLSPSVPPTKVHNSEPSPFGDVSPKLTSEQIAANISAEIKRMQRRRQLHYPNHPSPSRSPPPSSSISQDHMQSSSSSNSFLNSISPSKKDAPLFTFRQVSLLCERMLKEREDQIREEYDKVLTCKMAEQYEAFLKFNHDQIQKRFAGAPASYVS